MKRLSIITLIVLLLVSAKVFSQEKNFIRLASPENDTVQVSAPSFLINGITQKGSLLTVNGQSVKVYATGVFYTTLTLTEGKNELKLESVLNGKIETKTIVANYKKPEPARATSKFSIEYVRTIPEMDQWLAEGDVLQVKMKAFPGCKASFLNGQAMYELLPTETGGVRGIYQGTYKVKASDTLTNQTIQCTLETVNGDKISKQTAQRISFITNRLPIIAQTTDTLPYLNHGLGADRLGGARFGYIDTTALLTITGKAGKDYRVRLSSTQTAWIPERFVKILSQGNFLPQTLISSWGVTGDENYDYVRIGMGQHLPYVSWTESDPTRIIVDIFGGTANTNWLTQQLTTKEIKNAYFRQTDNETYRAIIELKHKQLWGYKIYFEKNSLVIRIRRQPEKLDLKNLTIALDAGHGGSNLGAVGVSGLREKDMNLDLNYRLKKILEDKGAKVILTRAKDTITGNQSRLLRLFKNEPHILISIHNNASGSPAVAGTSTYYKHIAYRPLTLYMYDELLKLGLKSFGNIGNFNFALNSPTEFPNVLVEGAFMSNPEDEILLMDENFRQKMAEAVYKGLVKFLKECKKDK